MPDVQTLTRLKPRHDLLHRARRDARERGPCVTAGRHVAVRTPAPFLSAATVGVKELSDSVNSGLSVFIGQGRGVMRTRFTRRQLSKLSGSAALRFHELMNH